MKNPTNESLEETSNTKNIEVDMEKTTKKKDAPVALTRAEKKDATKQLIRELLKKKEYKHNDLIDEVAQSFARRFEGEDTENINDVKGRVGSVLDIMKKENDVQYEGGMYALNVETPVGTPMESTTQTKESNEEKPVKKTSRAKTKKQIAETAELTETVEKQSTKTKKATKKAVKEVKDEQKEPKESEPLERIPLPAAPIQPIAPAPSITPETAPEPMPEVAPKKRGRKPKSVKEKAETDEKQAPTVALKQENEGKKETKETEIPEALPVALLDKKDEKAEEKEETAPKGVVMDMSFLFGDRKPTAKPVKEVKEEKTLTEEEPVQSIAKAKETQQAESASTVQETKPSVAVKKEQAPVKQRVQTQAQPKTQTQKTPKTPQGGGRKIVVSKVMTADEKLKEAFLKKLRTLGGDYFEYYSVYLLERYSMRNGRRLEGLKITGGDHDGGIDGEIELTDRFGFRETIYIQSKNWDPEKGDEKLWVVGETLLQQFVGACMCRQAKDGKQHCRGIFITTSRFTPDAKRMLDAMSDKIIGYDGNDLYETAKECEFGLMRKNGEWVLDEKILSGGKAFFQLY